ncbi:hypothetical protein INT80_14120 [Gallibacterium anatis]|uniref:Uncharacterized protein n=1 Tax=Gallibacterium anatis TaxID=750 RepID=A0A930USC2_9PAST|nr:hypothetical protein [Gallibacterium anatis]
MAFTYRFTLNFTAFTYYLSFIKWVVELETYFYHKLGGNCLPPFFVYA